MLKEREITQAMIGAAIEVHKSLGPGLLESAYEERLCYEMEIRGCASRRQVELPLAYKAIKLDCGYRLDVVVEDTVLLELKCVEGPLPVHEAQLLTYLRLRGIKLGLSMSVNIPVMRDGIVRRGL